MLVIVVTVMELFSCHAGGIFLSDILVVSFLSFFCRISDDICYENENFSDYNRTWPILVWPYASLLVIK